VKFARPLRIVPLLGLLTAGCAERPMSGVLLPVLNPVEGTSRVTILVASTRERSADAAQMFGGGRAGQVSYASVTVSIPPDGLRKAGDVQWPRTVPGDPRRDFVTLATNYLDKPGFDAAVAANAKETRRSRVVVFVHGFNNRFDDTVYRFAQIVHDAKAPVIPVLFAWPSRGQAALRAYTYDKESATFSRDAFDDLLDDLSRHRSVTEVNVLAHSMGNWIALEALRSRSMRAKQGGDKLKTVMLVAPDVDVDVFQAQLRKMGPATPQLALFVSRDDKALGMSEFISGGVPRLGEIDPEQEPYRSDLERARIDVFDVTTMRSTHAVNPGDTGAEGDQREHVEVARDQRLPSAPKERPPSPEHDRRGEEELQPV
jgi:esterase/lipase superfamily enzyme